MLLPKPGSVQFEHVSPGTYPARCYRFIDLGTQPKTFNKETKLVHQVRLSWELPTELMEKGDYAGKPFTVHTSYTWSMSAKAILRKSLENWRGKKFVDADFGEGGFNTKKLIGIPCMIGITHSESNGNTYANITTISPLLKGYVMPDQVNDSLYFSFDEAMAFGDPERKMYLTNFLEKVSKSTRDKIMGTPEYKKAAGVDDADDFQNHDERPDFRDERDYSEEIPF